MISLKIVIPTKNFDTVFPSLRDDIVRRSEGKIGIDIQKVQNGEFIEINSKFAFNPRSQEGDNASIPKDRNEFVAYVMDRYDEYVPRKFRLSTSLDLSDTQIFTILEIALDSILTQDMKDYVAYGNAMLYPIVNRNNGTEILCGIMEDGIERELYLSSQMQHNLDQMNRLVTVTELATRRIIARDPYEQYIVRKSGLPINSEGLIDIGNFLLMFPSRTYDLCIEEIKRNKGTRSSHSIEVAFIDKNEYTRDIIDSWCPKSTIPTIIDRLTILNTELDSPIVGFEMDSIANDMKDGNVPRVYMRYRNINGGSDIATLMALLYKLANVAYSRFVELIPSRIESTPVMVMPEYTDPLAIPCRRSLKSIIIRVPMVDIVQYRMYSRILDQVIMENKDSVYQIPRTVFLDTIPTLPSGTSIGLLTAVQDGLVVTIGNREYLVSKTNNIPRVSIPEGYKVPVDGGISSKCIDIPISCDGLYPLEFTMYSVYPINKKKVKMLSVIDSSRFLKFEQIESTLVVTSIVENIVLTMITHSGLMDFVDVISMLFSKGLFLTSYAKEYIDLKGRLPLFTETTTKGFFDWSLFNEYSDSSDQDVSNELMQKMMNLQS